VNDRTATLSAAHIVPSAPTGNALYTTKPGPAPLSSC
jgi:hypothetical protein